jgi:hypothetical protein
MIHHVVAELPSSLIDLRGDLTWDLAVETSPEIVGEPLATADVLEGLEFDEAFSLVGFPR